MTSPRPLYIIGVAVAAVLAAVYFMFDPAGSGWFPRCPFLTLTGFQCPGCGSQRAIHALLRGDIAGAWRLNALLLIELPFMGLLAVAWIMRRRRPRLRAILNSGPLILTVTTIIIIWTIVRNIAHI